MGKMSFVLLFTLLISIGVSTAQNTTSIAKELCQDPSHVFDCEERISKEAMESRGDEIPCALFCNQQIDCENQQDENEMICSNWTYSRTNVSTEVSPLQVEKERDEPCSDITHQFNCDGRYSQEHQVIGGDAFIPCYWFCNMKKTCPNGEDENKTVCTKWRERMELRSFDPLKVCLAARLDYSYFHCKHGNSTDHDEWGKTLEDDNELPCFFFCDGHPDCVGGTDEDPKTCIVWKELKNNYYSQFTTTKKLTTYQTTKSPVNVQVENFKENLFATIIGNLIFVVVFIVIYLLFKWKKRRNKNYFQQKDNLDIELITRKMKETNEEIV